MSADNIHCVLLADLLPAIEAVQEGKTFVSSGVKEQVLDKRSPSPLEHQ